MTPHLSALMFLPLGTLPVLCFLALLLFLDSFKLVRLSFVLSAIGIGMLLAVPAFLANRIVLTAWHLDFMDYAHFGSPFIEEFLKAGAVYLLIRSNRMGFLIDAAIVSFSIGAGFALAENIFYLYTIGHSSLAVWIVRGFGTAVMHGGATAIFAILSLAITEQVGSTAFRYYLPGYLAGVLIHGTFNQLAFSPYLATLITVIALPLLMYFVFDRSTAALKNWLELDFEADADLLRQIASSEFEATAVGAYLTELQQRFDPLIIVDMLCYVRNYTELSMRAKGVMLMREQNLEMPPDPAVEDKFSEMKYLEKSIGRTGMLALDPLLHMDAKDLWHLNVLEASTR
ncbi:MAG TPA: PrsW family glutamic-type intramembrane protease [Pseudomonadales bacterium]|nr:PrsW family glutamic-type intramembrane protease [Pseudomonadales bacterium]